MNPNVGMLIVVTEEFDAMKQFFVDLGFEITPDHLRIGLVTPRFNQKRGCLIMLPSLMISLEESAGFPPSGPLYMEIDGIDEARLLSLKGKYSIKHVKGTLIGAEFYAIKPPGGGLVHARTG